MSSRHHPTLRLLASELLDSLGRYGVSSEDVDLAVVTGVASRDGSIVRRNNGRVGVVYKEHPYTIDYGRLSYPAEYFLGRKPKDFVVQCYLSLLKRLPDEGGFQFYLEALGSGRMSRVDALRRVSSSEEGKRIGVEFNPPLPKPEKRPQEVTRATRRRRGALGLVLRLGETARERVKTAWQRRG